jgi:capsular polysaccharide biosynthesis protein
MIFNNKNHEFVSDSKNVINTFTYKENALFSRNIYYSKQSEKINSEKINSQKKFFKLYSFKLFNSYVIGETPGFFINKDFYAPMFSDFYSNRYNFSFRNVKHVNSKKIILKYYNSLTIIEKGISLLTFAPSNYFHFIYDVLSRFYFIDKYFDKDIPILLDEVIFKNKNLLDLLHQVNINKRSIIYIKKFTKVLVRTLYFPPITNFMPINFKNKIGKDSDYFFLISPILYLRNLFRKSILNQSNVTTYLNGRYFVSRSKSRNSRLINEDEIKHLLKPLKFNEFSPELMEINNQMLLFYGSKIIIGSTGSAFASMIFSMKSIRLFIIIPKPYKFFAFSSIAKILGLNVFYFDAKITKKSEHASIEKFVLTNPSNTLNYIKSSLSK